MAVSQQSLARRSPQPSAACPAIVLLGVPRSGTTLLRVLLGSHPSIQAACETPWICGGYGSNSLRHLVAYLNGDPLGPVANLSGVSADDVLAASRAFVMSLLESYRLQSGKERVLIKTPDDVGHLDFLVDQFPGADFVHIYRDGRDVACSTVQQKGKLLGKHIPPYGEICLESALRRWKDWEGAIRRAISAGGVRSAISCSYEELVADPKRTLTRICDFLGMAYSDAMLAFAAQKHELPAWEAGSQDVRARPTVDPASVGKWKSWISPREFARIDAEIGDALEAYGYRRCCESGGVESSRSGQAAASEAIARGLLRVRKLLGDVARRARQFAGAPLAPRETDGNS